MLYANHYGWSDINPFEVVKTVSDKTLEVRAMEAKLHPDWKPEFVPGGFSAHCTNNNEQDWVITSNTENKVFRIRLHANGVWKDKNGNKYHLNDKPIKHYDYNF